MATTPEVLDLLVGRLAAVMAVDAEQISPAARFDEDLHADSLDLVEVVEGVEQDLRERGQPSHLSDEELVGLRTVGEAAERIAAQTSGESEAR